MSGFFFASRLGALQELLGPAGADHLVLGASVAALAGLWLWTRASLGQVRARSGELTGLLEAHELRLAELEADLQATDPGARARRDEELVKVLGSLLSYTESVRGDGAEEGVGLRGVDPCP